MFQRRSMWLLALGLLFGASPTQGIEPFAPPDPRISADDGTCASVDGSCSAFYATAPERLDTKGKVLLQVKGMLKHGHVSKRRDHKTIERPILVTFFSVECNSYFDWQTATLYHSWKRTGVPGQLVRILACPAADRQNNTRFDNLGWDMQTHVHEPASKVYPPLNKPFGIWSWLTHEGSELPDDTIIAMVDADMVFVEEAVQQILQPLVESLAASKDPPAMGTDYLYTVRGMRYNNWTIPHHFKINDVEKLQSIGPPIFLTKKRWLQILPEYHRFTREIIQNETLKALVHDGNSPAPWITEMYGYTLATVGFQHDIKTLSIAQPPWGDDQPLLVHYCHTFHLCQQTFGKVYFNDLLGCTSNSTIQNPPSQQKVAGDSCRLCLKDGEVIATSSECFEPKYKQWAWYAWDNVYNTVQSWRETHCPES